MAAAILIPAALQRDETVEKVGVVGPGPTAALTVRVAARIADTDVETVAWERRGGEGSLRAGGWASSSSPAVKCSSLAPPTRIAHRVEAHALALAGGLVRAAGRRRRRRLPSGDPGVQRADHRTERATDEPGRLMVSYMLIVVYGVRITIV